MVSRMQPSRRATARRDTELDNNRVLDLGERGAPRLSRYHRPVGARRGRRRSLLLFGSRLEYVVSFVDAATEEPKG